MITILLLALSVNAGMKNKQAPQPQNSLMMCDFNNCDNATKALIKKRKKNEKRR